MALLVDTILHGYVWLPHINNPVFNHLFMCLYPISKCPSETSAWLQRLTVMVEQMNEPSHVFAFCLCLYFGRPPSPPSVRASVFLCSFS